MRFIVLCLLSRAALLPLVLFAQPSADRIRHDTGAVGHTAASTTGPSERPTVPPKQITTGHPIRPEHWPRLHIPDPVGRQAASKALDLAWERLAQSGCGAVLTTFKDQAARPLAHRLGSLSVDLQTYLTMLVFIDGSREARCASGTFAFTAPGSRVIRLCVEELKRTWLQDHEHTVANFIHEMLHTLGLGENPPSSAEITRRVHAACRSQASKRRLDVFDERLSTIVSSRVGNSLIRGAHEPPRRQGSIRAWSRRPLPDRRGSGAASSRDPPSGTPCPQQAASNSGASCD